MTKRLEGAHARAEALWNSQRSPKGHWGARQQRRLADLVAMGDGDSGGHAN